MLEKLTPEMESMIPVIRDEWISRAYNPTNINDIDEGKLQEAINWLYKMGKFRQPKIAIVDSPKAAQELANRLMREENPDHVDTYYHPSWAFGIMNYSWVAFYDYFTKIGVVNNDDFNRYCAYTKELPVYDTVQFEELCIVSRMPEFIKSTIYRWQRVPHCADGPAIRFKDGYSVYYWNGTIIPDAWIMDKDSITKDEILKQENAEMRRCLMEILGAKRYYDILTDGNGLTLLDEDIDLQGNPMRLYETTAPDAITNNKVQFLEVIDPSTGRVYNIYPPKQDATNVWAAKAQTFSDKNLFVRQGDVGLVRSDYRGSVPVQET